MVPGAVLYSILAGLATVFGGMLVLLFGRPTHKALAVLLGMAAGIMGGVVVLDLLPSALAYGSLSSTALGLGLGFVLLFFLDAMLTGSAPSSPREGESRYFLGMGYLMATGIALHDFPEGMAIAVGFAAAPGLGWMVALAIGLHNVPEGMVTAAPLRMGGMPVSRVLGLNMLVSLVTPLGTLAGLWLVGMYQAWISPLLSLAAGAMAYLVTFKLVPVAFRRHPNYARLGGILGLVILLILTLSGH